ncbi:class I SAM-dependent methyltransferase [Streptomyces sp. enrichment culture]|uniref:class I SAM-dependent methyltransferase n=1 Tax=Streptomyces sp. enrichment culture TaxID=1795815 RepID=UPI003F544952
MPRGGPDAARWDRRFETSRAEYIDRPDTPEKGRQVLRALDRFQRLTGGYRTFCRLTLAQARGVPDPRLLELGAGLGRLARYLTDRHPTARVTVSDVDPDVVERIRRGPVGAHPRVTPAVLDATRIDAPDGAFDVAVLTMTLHHLPAPGVVALLEEGTRVARRLLIIDGWRHPAGLAVAPLLWLTGGLPHLHDGLISLRRLYGAQALHALAGACTPAVAVRTRFVPPGYLVAVATRDRQGRRADRGAPAGRTGTREGGLLP